MKDDEVQSELRELALRGSGMGSTILYNCLSLERADENFDWRRAAIALAQQANRLGAIATDALTMSPPPIVLAPAAVDRDAVRDEAFEEAALAVEALCHSASATQVAASYYGWGARAIRALKSQSAKEPAP